jgi:hypothetical protein
MGTISKKITATTDRNALTRRGRPSQADVLSAVRMITGRTQANRRERRAAASILRREVKAILKLPVPEWQEHDGLLVQAFSKLLKKS